jgi:hypothetical protein
LAAHFSLDGFNQPVGSPPVSSQDRHDGDKSPSAYQLKDVSDQALPPYFRRQTNTGLPRRMSYFRRSYGLPVAGVNATRREFLANFIVTTASAGDF